MNGECGLESSARLHEIPNKKLENLRCTEIGIGPVEGRSASSLLQVLNLAEGTLSVKGPVASGELKRELEPEKCSWTYVSMRDVSQEFELAPLGTSGSLVGGGSV